MQKNSCISSLILVNFSHEKSQINQKLPKTTIFEVFKSLEFISRKIQGGQKFHTVFSPLRMQKIKEKKQHKNFRLHSNIVKYSVKIIFLSNFVQNLMKYTLRQSVQFSERVPYWVKLGIMLCTVQHLLLAHNPDLFIHQTAAGNGSRSAWNHLDEFFFSTVLHTVWKFKNFSTP